jgi:hypothetical protein
MNTRKKVTDIELIVVGVSLLSIAMIFWITRLNTDHPTTLWWIYLRDCLSTIAGLVSLLAGIIDLVKNKKPTTTDAA